MRWIRSSPRSLVSVVVVVLVLVGAIGCAAALAAAALPDTAFLVDTPAMHRVGGAREIDGESEADAPAAALRRAVASTLAARSARIEGRVSSPRAGVVAEVRGTTSFVDPLGTFTITTVTNPAPTEICIRGDTAWVTTGPGPKRRSRSHGCREYRANPACGWGRR